MIDKLLFQLQSVFQPGGDQPKAIDKLCNGILNNEHNQVLLGITGSGKTFTMANVINKLQRPALIMAHNKTLAAQLYSEMKQFFPNNAVEYFVSYYDYYQPEAYIAQTDTYIEKDSSINEKIDLLRHSATRSLLERQDVIVVASVSCIYGIGSPDQYSKMVLAVKLGEKLSRNSLVKRLIAMQYQRNDMVPERGSFRVLGDSVEIFPIHTDSFSWKLSFWGDEIEKIVEYDFIRGKKIRELKAIVVYASSHYVTPIDQVQKAVQAIKEELKERLAYFYSQNKLLEAQRIEQRTQFDIEMMVETGTCKGIENYSRHLIGYKAGDPPPTLFQYLPKDTLLFIDESHVTVPQISAMFNGDRARKTNLVEHGFRLPSALDNRPLTFAEWDGLRPQTVFVSATPGSYELTLTNNNVIEQIIRPTGLLDPEIIIKPVENQIDDLIGECKKATACGERVLVTTLTKKMAENLAEYLGEVGVKVMYMHSEIKTLERVEIIQSLRKGDIDVLVGVNLLREGLDIPECALVAILDADKEGFLRSEISLIQTIGRAARNVNGRVIMYADVMTKSIQNAMKITQDRRVKQIAYNKQHNITPTTILKDSTDNIFVFDIADKQEELVLENEEQHIKTLRKKMLEAAANLEFEKAAELRNKLNKIEQGIIFNKS